MIDIEEMDRAAALDKSVRGETVKQAIFRIADRALALTQQKRLSVEHYRLVDDGAAFFRRYFIRKDRQWRFAFMCLKAKHSLPDERLQLFYFTGNLRLRDGEMHITVDSWVANVGWIFIALLSFVYATQAISLIAGLPFSWALVKGCLYILGMATLTTIGYHRAYVKPWELGRALKEQ